jgi:hypothetical protein
MENKKTFTLSLRNEEPEIPVLDFFTTSLKEDTVRALAWHGWKPDTDITCPMFYHHSYPDILVNVSGNNNYVRLLLVIGTKGEDLYLSFDFTTKSAVGEFIRTNIGSKKKDHYKQLRELESLVNDTVTLSRLWKWDLILRQDNSLFFKHAYYPFTYQCVVAPTYIQGSLFINNEEKPFVLYSQSSLIDFLNEHVTSNTNSKSE